MKRIAIFGSGGGSNAHCILEYLNDYLEIEVSLILSNKAGAGIFNHALEFGVPTLLLNRQEFYESETLLNLLSEKEVDLIVLAGFLWLIPEYLIQAYPDKIINVHPALLPKFGGKGMYGMNVHRAVKEAGESESGITIHTIDEEYDRGKILYQEAVGLDGTESPEQIAAKVLKVEHANFARVVAEYLS
ncbi:MAG: phosphoribosylglycinamide formyltransferase-1 [Flavobacteriales bacterium]|jgi:phosphoribosylglycinamide formyltransferase-1